MRTNCLEVNSILKLFIIYVVRHAICETVTEMSTEKSLDDKNSSSSVDILKSVNSMCKSKICYKYFMATMGTLQPDLLNAQAIIVKDEDLKGACDKADRTSEKRYLMCAGSILNRNHLLTSASCIHTATHIRHNIRGTFAATIAPLKPSSQVIRITEYRIHPTHDTNPYGENHLTHNLAILKLACRIDVDNFHKIELPQAPMVQTCSEDNCIVAIYRKIGMTRWVMHEVSASSNVLMSNRRRKETLIKDRELRSIWKYKPSAITNNYNDRPKRKLAAPPIFFNWHESRENNEDANDILTNFTIISTTKNLPIDQTTIIYGKKKNSSFVTATSLEDVDDEDVSSTIGKETIKSIAMRSTNGYRGCPHTGSAIMVNKTQAAVVSVPCDDRQPSKKWGLTDIYNNLDWIHNILQDWSSSGPGGNNQGKPGNFSSCSTCIFNFFIDFGCKGNNQCGNKSTSLPSKTNNGNGHTSNSNDCTGSNTMGIDIDFGQGCDKTSQKFNNITNSRGNRADLKHFSDSTNDNSPKLESSVTVRPMKMPAVNYQRNDQDRYLQNDNSRISESSRTIPEHSSSITRAYKTTKIDNNKNRAMVSNEVGLQNIDGESTDWITQVEKRLTRSDFLPK